MKKIKKLIKKIFPKLDKGKITVINTVDDPETRAKLNAQGRG